jgi:hypothetical protein
MVWWIIFRPVDSGCGLDVNEDEVTKATLRQRLVREIASQVAPSTSELTLLCPYESDSGCLYVYIYIPEDPCMEYLPTLTPKVI